MARDQMKWAGRERWIMCSTANTSRSEDFDSLRFQINPRDLRLEINSNHQRVTSVLIWGGGRENDLMFFYNISEQVSLNTDLGAISSVRSNADSVS